MPAIFRPANARAAIVKIGNDFLPISIVTFLTCFVLSDIIVFLLVGKGLAGLLSTAIPCLPREESLFIRLPLKRA